MTYIRTLKGGKSQIMKAEAFCALLHKKLPAESISLSDLIDDISEQVRKFDKTIKGNALNNARGDWYEWLLGFAAWNYSVENKKANFALLSPNISQFDTSRLYNNRLFGLIQDLREKVLIASGVKLISSNPDFVIIQRELFNKIVPKVKKIDSVSLDSILMIENTIKKFENKCEFEDIIGYVSAKLSFRSDRRFQLPHEGSLMKALYTHLQTREWIINPKGLKFYGISSKATKADKSALKTVATHSITTVHSLPQAAVDEVFEVNSLQQARIAFYEILNA